MDEINFLANKKDEKKGEKTEKKKPEENIEWTKPIEEKSSRKNNFGWFGIFSDKKEKKINKKLLNKDLLKNSRLEILKLIKQHESNQLAKHEINIENKSGFYSWLNNIFEKKGNKEILVDYQKVFEHDKKKKKIPEISLAAKEEPNLKKKEEKEAVIASAKVKPDSWFSKFKKLFILNKKKAEPKTIITDQQPAQPQAQHNRSPEGEEPE